jgi:aspartyl/asparaginyl beta-hydroxylase (cupin superfamily)
VKRFIKNYLPVLVVLPLAYFFPKVVIPFLLCGAYDVARNRALDASKVRQYFFGNGALTWVLSPLNILLDILTLPYINRGIYRLEDLPKPYAAEVQRLIDAAHREELVGKLDATASARSRTMAFFKWYGANQETVVDIPAFHEKYRYIKTIGVSVFNKRQSTSRHFGPFRATLRVLYNINSVTSPEAYIEVGDVKHVWRDNKLFIFDDTLMHQSFNETDQARYCLFVDILRPSLVPWLLSGVVSSTRFFLQGANAVFYKNWDVVKKPS